LRNKGVVVRQMIDHEGRNRSDCRENGSLRTGMENFRKINTLSIDRLFAGTETGEGGWWGGEWREEMLKKRRDVERIREIIRDGESDTQVNQ